MSSKSSVPTCNKSCGVAVELAGTASDLVGASCGYGPCKVCTAWRQKARYEV